MSAGEANIREMSPSADVRLVDRRGAARPGQCAGRAAPPILRLYEPHELGRDGYPLAWHRCPTCVGTGWLCAATGAPWDERRGTCCAAPGGCPSSNGCPDCSTPTSDGGTGAIKHMVREEAGHRCVRCLHPYHSGVPQRAEWSPCDERCAHAGPIRSRRGAQTWCYSQETVDELPGRAGQMAAQGRDVEARWRILTVHHLDGVKANCRWWNLSALCQRCHLQIQGKVQMARVWPWEHTPWFQPYVAGYYAHAYLGEDLTREETEVRLDELLALERVA